MISIFDLFSIGIGPSSSHTVGPMRAAYAFNKELVDNNILTDVAHINVELFGSLAYTGKGHGTESAIAMGLEQYQPETVNPSTIEKRMAFIKENHALQLAKSQMIHFKLDRNIIYNTEELLPLHNNGMRFTAFDKHRKAIVQSEFYSVGGGFVITAEENLANSHTGGKTVPYQFNTAEELTTHCQSAHKTIAEIIMANELVTRTETEIKQGTLHIVQVMFDSIDSGMKNTGILPGGLHVKRRAHEIARKLSHLQKEGIDHFHTDSIDWLNVFAIAVNEENAAGGRVVTAPTNGAAGVIPAVLKYYTKFHPDVTDDAIVDFMLTAAAIGILFKKGASISAAEVGCQGEVGVASSMAAGALAAVKGGTISQVCSAAEIAMEHNLGLTCDPVHGLVQVPCIERNAIGAVKAVSIARLALLESGEEKQITLDTVIKTMLKTGHDMNDHYKETSKGGLANIKVNIVEC